MSATTETEQNTPTWCFKHSVERTACRCDYLDPRTGRIHRAGTLPLRYRILNRAQLATIPPPSPLIDGVIDKGTMTLLSGHWGTLKSFTALDWAASIATGRRWMGRTITAGPHRVLYIAAEGATGLHDRLTAWEMGWGETIDPDTFQTLPAPVNLGHPGDVRDMVDIITDTNTTFVVVDTLARCITGLEENSAKDMGVAVDALDQLKHATRGGTVLTLHHTGKDKVTTRGSSALEDGVDMVYRAEGDAQNVLLTCEKRKDAPSGEKFRVKFAPVKGAKSGVVESHMGVRIDAPSAAGVWDVFLTHFSETGASRSELVAVAETAGVPKSSAYRAINMLVEDGSLTNSGTDSRPFYQRRTG